MVSSREVVVKKRAHLASAMQGSPCRSFCILLYK